MNKRRTAQGAAIGVGYVSVMIIFAVICLTIFAVLSFCAANSNDALNERSGEFINQYYSADSSAKETLARLDEYALGAADAFSFGEAFESGAAELDNVSIKRTSDGFLAQYSVDINERQELAVSVLFFSDTALHEGSRYEITAWRSQLKDSGETADEHLGVWDGSF